MAALTASCASGPDLVGDSGPLLLHQRYQTPTSDGEYELVHQARTWEPARTALVICDMWDRHWCVGAERRVAEMAPRLNELVRRARDRGVFVIHAPSTCVAFYEGTEPRARAVTVPHAVPPVPLSQAQRWGTAWCWPQDEREPGMPIDDSDMGCDCEPRCGLHEPWTRQIASIVVDPRDAVTDNGQETYNLLAARDIDNVILTGVHLNMCVLGRPFGIRQLVNLGKKVVLMRDMTDTMYNSRMAPHVSHFRGTDLVVEHVERYWCPTITSEDMTGVSPFRFAEDTGQ